MKLGDGNNWDLVRELDQIDSSLAADTILRDGERYARIIEDGGQVVAYFLECPGESGKRPCEAFTCHYKALAWVLRKTIYSTQAVDWYQLAFDLYAEAEDPGESELSRLRRENAKLKLMLARQGVAA